MDLLDSDSQSELEMEFAANDSELDHDGDSIIMSPSILNAPQPTPPAETRRNDANSPHREAHREDSGTPAPILRHHEFWFSDGSIVLLARYTMFRVHKSFIARHSVIFRDMFSIPQPDEEAMPETKRAESFDSKDGGEGLGTMGTTEVDGCPVVHLYDSPEDVASLLYALYDGPYVVQVHGRTTRITDTSSAGNSVTMIEPISASSLEFYDWPTSI
jgi:hypothetical protein